MPFKGSKVTKLSELEKQLFDLNLIYFWPRQHK